MEAPKIKYILREQDILKASQVFDIDVMTLRKLNDQRLLNTEYMRDVLVRFDYDKLTRGCKYLVAQNKAYTFPEVMKAIQQEYGISRQTLNSILHGKNNRTMHFCKLCGQRINGRTAERTGGLCSNCHADTLEL
jgi:hypothetical protein